MEKEIKIRNLNASDQINGPTGLYSYSNNVINRGNLNINVERNPSLRIRDSNIPLPGILRYNSALQQFQGYTDLGWKTFENTTGLNGVDGVNSISQFEGVNISNDGEAFGIFKDVISETVATTTVAETVVNNQIENIFTAPAFAFSDFNYGSEPGSMELSGKNVVFIPHNSYRVFVRNNESYPPVNYYGHQKVRDLNQGKIATNNNYRHYLQGSKFKFYNTDYSYVYIHENGYLNFIGGDTTLLIGKYPNHFTDIRISAFLNNLENTSDEDATNSADIYVGRGPYGEEVITYNNFSAIEIDPNDSASTIKDNYNNFQIRLWTNNVNYNSSEPYRDDNYPPGTIQISYGRCEHLTPLVGLSNKQLYVETSFQPIPYSNYIDGDYTETTGLGVPQLEATLIVKMSNTSQIPLIASKFDVTNAPVQSTVASSSDKYKLIVKNKNWTSAFSEKLDGITYYTRIFDFGAVNTIEGFYVVIKGLHDDAYSDISNREVGMSTIDISGWENGDVTPMIDLTSFYSATRNKDYHQIYTQNAFNIADSKNTYLHNIQMKYVDVNVEATSGTDTTRLYTGAVEKRLFFKITYRLKSDEELPVGNDSFANAAVINLPTLSTSETKFNNGGNERFNFIPGSDDYYEFSLSLHKTYELKLFDNSPDAPNTRNNFGLGMELYLKPVDTTAEPILYKSVTFTDINDNLNSYPGNLLDKQFENSDANSIKTFYLKIVSNIKSYFYGISIKESNSPSLTTNILTFTILETNYNLLTTDERNNLKSVIRGMVRDTVSNDSIVDANSMEVVLERVVTSAGNKNILVTVILGSVPLGEIESVATALSSTITFTFEEESEAENNEVTKNINNPTANTISLNNKPTDTIPVSDGGSNPTIPSSNDFTTKDVFTLMKANYLNGDVNMHHFPQNAGLVSYFDKYCHTSIKTSDGKILYCYFSLKMSPTNPATTTQELRLKVFYRSQNDVFADVVVDTLNYTAISELNDYPFNILNQNNKIVVLYGIKDGTSKNLCCKQYTATVTVDNTVSITKTSFEYSLKASEAAAAAAGGTNNYTNKQATINKYNTGIVDNENNLYIYEIKANSVETFIIKFNESFVKTTIDTLSYQQDTINKLYHTEDRFTTTNYIYYMQEYKQQYSNSHSHYVFRINKNQIPDIQVFKTLKLPNYIAVIKPDNSLYFNSKDTSKPSILTDYQNLNYNNKLTEISDFTNLNFEDYFFAITKTGKVLTWGSASSYDFLTPVNIDQVISYHRNYNSIAFLRYDAINERRTVMTFGDKNNGAGNYRSEFNLTTFITEFTLYEVGNQVGSIHPNYSAYAALTLDSKIKSWGKFSSSTAMNDDTDSGGNFEQYSGALLATKGLTASEVTTELANIATLKFLQIFSTINSFAALTEQKRLYTWGNKYQAYQGNLNPVDSNILNFNTNIYLENIESVKTTSYSYAVLVKENPFDTNKPAYKVHCFGGNGYKPSGSTNYQFLSADPPSQTPAVNFSSFNNYGEYLVYYDFGTSAYVKHSSNDKVKTLYSNGYAFAALLYDETTTYAEDVEDDYKHKVITWGYSNSIQNYGGAPYYQNNNTNAWVSIASELTSGVKAIVSNEKAFLAIKKDKIVVWGHYDCGGSPFVINTTSSQVTTAVNLSDTFYQGLNENNIIPSSEAFAIFKDEKVRFVGSVENLDTSNSNISALTNNGYEISNVRGIQCNYDELRQNNKHITTEVSVFTITFKYTGSPAADNFLLTKYYSSSSNNPAYQIGDYLGLNFYPINYTFDTAGLDNYDFIYGYQERNNLLFGALGSDYYYLKRGSASYYSLYRNRNPDPIVSFSGITAYDKILQFEFLTANSKKYLIIVYQNTSGNRLLELVELNDFLGDIKKINDNSSSASVAKLDGIKLIQDKLFSYYFDSNTPNFVAIDIYNLNNTSRTTGIPTVTDIYVSVGQLSTPYYTFHATNDVTSSPISNFSLNTNQTYRFHRLGGATSHPFYISDVGYEIESSYKITLSGDGNYNTGIIGAQSFTLTFNGVWNISDNLRFYCTSHSTMISNFTVNIVNSGLPTVSYSLANATPSNYKIYNDKNSRPSGTAGMPNNYQIKKFLANPITSDITTGKYDFFMIGRTDTAINAEDNFPKYNYFLFQYDEQGNSRSFNQDNFNQYQNNFEESITDIEESIVGEPDILNIQDTIQDGITNSDNIKILHIENNYVATFYQSESYLYLKIYNNSDFVEEEVASNISETQNLSISSSDKLVDIRWQIQNIFYMKRYQLKEDNELELIWENNIELISNTSFQYLLSEQYLTYFVYSIELENERKTKIEMLDLDSNLTQLFLGAEVEINKLAISGDILYLVTSQDKYYEFNILHQVLESKDLINPIQQETVLWTPEKEILGLVSVSDGKLSLMQNQLIVLDLGIKEVEILKYDLLGDDKLVLVYEKENEKTIVIFNYKTQEYVRYRNRFEFLVSTENRILLFDTRNLRNQITVRYLDFSLNLLNLNIFENLDFTYQSLVFISSQNSNISLAGQKTDPDDIEDSFMYDMLVYQDVSKGSYSTLLYLNPTEESEVSLGSSDNLALSVIDTSAIPIFQSRNTAQTEHIVVLVADVYITGGKYLLEQVKTSGTGEGVYNAAHKYILKEGTYILKDVPFSNPLAILVKHATGDKNMISYRGLSYNNINPNNVGSSLVNQIEEDNVTHSYFFYYGDIEIKVLGDFGEVSFHSYNNGYMGGEKKLKYKAHTRPNETESNKIYERVINRRTPLVPFTGADPQNSSFLIGRSKDISYSAAENDSGSILYSFVKSYYDYQQEQCLYLRSNGLPNYQPSIGGNIYQGDWSNEQTMNFSTPKVYYAAYYHHRGWIDINNTVLGNMYKIPLEPKIATQNIYQSASGLFNENFWYNDDLYWKTIMEDTKYDIKLFTPMGSIAVALNGVSFYNFAVMQNTITETYQSSQLSSGNFDYISSSPIITTLSTNNSLNVVNGVEIDTSPQVFDNQGGTVDLNHHYHYHYYPIALEGLITFGTISNRVYSEVFDATGLVAKIGFKMFIGHTYYLNVNDHTHLTSNNENLYLGFTHSSDYTTEFKFNNTLLRNGEPGVGIGSYVKFTVPSSFTTSDKLQLVYVKNDLTSTAAADILITSYGGFYNSGSPANIDCSYREVTLKLSLDAGNSRFVIADAANVAFDTNNLLYFEKDILYTINLDTTYTSSDKEIKFRRSNGINYSPALITYNSNNIQLRFNEEVSGLNFYNNTSADDGSGDNYINFGVFKPESIHYYVRVNPDTNQYNFYENNSLGNFKFNGMIDWEDANLYLTEKMKKKGPQGHSPLLGYAFDGFPIYGPLGYDKTDSNYYSTDMSNVAVKLLRSGYSGANDSNGNPSYNPNLANKDLDFCNGRFARTPEFPNGIYYYVCTIQLNADGTPKLENTNIEYTFRNVVKSIIKPAYPYIIGAYKGIPDIYNFPWANSQGAISNTNIEKKKFTFNFKSIKSEETSLNGKTQKSISITQDSSNLSLLVNSQNYQWNFSNTQQTSIFGRDGLSFGNKISDLKSTNSDTVFKAYGKINKWVSFGAITKGTCVTITFQEINGEAGLYVKTYNITSSETDENTDILGVALNTVDGTGKEVYVCQEGITTIKIGSNLGVKCSSYGVISNNTSILGSITALGPTSNILSNTAVVGTFLENNNSVSEGDLILFKVKTNYEFN